MAEAGRLAERGVRELIVIGQDTTFYGLDLYGERRLAPLLERLSSLGGVEWVRLMYAYPAKFPMEVLEVMGRRPNICRYLDIPVQHASDTVLKSMQRGISARAQQRLLDRIREALPGVALRTTLIVGYPTETEREFEELVRFVQEMGFDRLGVFAYSREEGTAAYSLGDPVPPEEKERRRSVVMELQREISDRKNAALVGSRQRVLVDRKEPGGYAGRTERDAPEVDNEVLIRTRRRLRPGEFYEVDILESYEYDLVGSVS
jgi:ribosomal protein S12 methylthiotransferase